MPDRSILITEIGELVTMDEVGPLRRPGPADLGLRYGAAVWIQDGLVRAVGTCAELEKSVPTDIPRWSAAGRLVTPGLIDSHTHMAVAGERSEEWELRARGATYAQIAERGGGIRASMRATRACSFTDLVARTGRHLDWARTCGTTTIEVKSGYGLETEAELHQLRAARAAADARGMTLVSTFLGAHAVPPESGGRNEYLAHVLEEMLPRVKGEAHFADIFVEEGYFTPACARRYAAAAQAAGLGLRLHVDQMRDGGGASLAVELGAAAADHLEFTGEAGIRALGASPTTAGLLPASVLGLRSGQYPNGRALVDAGAVVVIATDFNPGSSPTPSLPLCMRLAVDFCGLTVTESWAAVTRNAAASLGLQDRGALAPGLVADLVVWDLESHREVPYWMAAPSVHAVLQGGAWADLNPSV
jgi:imidazolonepropionase